MDQSTLFQHRWWELNSEIGNRMLESKLQTKAKHHAMYTLRCAPSPLLQCNSVLSVPSEQCNTHTACCLNCQSNELDVRVSRCSVKSVNWLSACIWMQFKHSFMPILWCNSIDRIAQATETSDLTWVAIHLHSSFHSICISLFISLLKQHSYTNMPFCQQSMHVTEIVGEQWCFIYWLHLLMVIGYTVFNGLTSHPWHTQLRWVLSLAQCVLLSGVSLTSLCFAMLACFQLHSRVHLSLTHSLTLSPSRPLSPTQMFLNYTSHIN